MSSNSNNLVDLETNKMEIFINEHGKFNKAVLPLRFGFSINQTHQSFATLDGAVFDQLGTSTQRGDEIERGNKHYLGNLIVSPS